MSNPNNHEPRCIVIMWQGKELGEPFAASVKNIMAQMGIIVELVDYYEMDGESLAKSAYLRALATKETVILPEDIDPIATSIEVVGKRYSKFLESGPTAFAVQLTGDVIAEIHKASNGIPKDLALISAIEILATKTITSKYSKQLRENKLSHTTLETIRNVYSVYHGTQPVL